MNRRGFLKLLGGGTIAIILGYFSYKKFKDYPKASTPIKLNIFTPNEEFFLQHEFGVPDIDIDNWSLKVEGKVKHPLSLTYREITSMPSILSEATLECISNPVGGNLVGTALWTGIPLKDILEKAKVESDVKDIIFHSAEGYSDSIPIDKAGEAILAFRMNGETLSKEHGYPLRAAVPGIHGMKWLKWITHIKAVDYDFKGYWQRKGWSDEATVDIATKIINPERGEEISENTYSIFGLAWGGNSGIQKVEVSLDRGESWNVAQIIYAPTSPYMWTTWKYVWNTGEKGKYSVEARAVDKEGSIQSRQSSHPFPNGASGLHKIEIEVT